MILYNDKQDKLWLLHWELSIPIAKTMAELCFGPPPPLIKENTIKLLFNFSKIINTHDHCKIVETLVFYKIYYD